jgi:hypothetical protein
VGVALADGRSPSEPGPDVETHGAAGPHSHDGMRILLPGICERCDEWHWRMVTEGQWFRVADEDWP